MPVTTRRKTAAKKTAENTKSEKVTRSRSKMPSQKEQTEIQRANAGRKKTLTSTNKEDIENKGEQLGLCVNTVPDTLKTQNSKSDSSNDKDSDKMDKLNILFSNLYMNSVQRLRLQFPPRCAEDLVYCKKEHFDQRSTALHMPSPTISSLHEVLYQQQSYISFITLTRTMCQRREFPGERTFTKIIEILLSLNPKSDMTTFGLTYQNLIDLFLYIVRVFPPCWFATRSAYIEFFQSPFDNKKIYAKTTQKSKKIFETILDLLEHTLAECTSEDLAASDIQTVPESMTLSESMIHGDARSFDHIQWEQRYSQLNTFTALDLNERLDRLFVVLTLIIQVLEYDFTMWLLYHYEKNSDFMFYTDSKPLAIFVYGLSVESLLSNVSRQLLLLFIVAVNKGLRRDRLQVLERYVALLMVISNTVEIELTAAGVIYPRLGRETQRLISEFFRKFKGRNVDSTIDSYVNTIEVLRIPYMRFTFIDLFLQNYGGLQDEQFSPEKVYNFLNKKSWLKLKKQEELRTITKSKADEMSREKYLALLLNALKAYCEWHACKGFKQVFMDDKTISRLQLTTPSPLHTPTRLGDFDLESMERDIAILEGQLRETVRASKLKNDLLVIKMHIDEDLITKYRRDLYYLNCMYENVTENVQLYDDFSLWQAFLGDFKTN